MKCIDPGPSKLLCRLQILCCQIGLAESRQIIPHFQKVGLNIMGQMVEIQNRKYKNEGKVPRLEIKGKHQNNYYDKDVRSFCHKRYTEPD